MDSIFIFVGKLVCGGASMVRANDFYAAHQCFFAGADAEAMFGPIALGPVRDLGASTFQFAAWFFVGWFVVGAIKKHNAKTNQEK